jgi:hypothetical protein
MPIVFFCRWLQTIHKNIPPPSSVYWALQPKYFSRLLTFMAAHGVLVFSVFATGATVLPAAGSGPAEDVDFYGW